MRRCAKVVYSIRMHGEKIKRKNERIISHNEIAYYYTIIGTLGMLIPNIQGFSFVVIGKKLPLDTDNYIF